MWTDLTDICKDLTELTGEAASPSVAVFWEWVGGFRGCTSITLLPSLLKTELEVRALRNVASPLWNVGRFRSAAVDVTAGL